MSISEPVSGLIPINGCVLVELKQSYSNLSVKQGKYDTHTEGIVVSVPNGGEYDKYKDVCFKRVYFEEFKEGARIKRGGKLYSFIKFEDIRGFEDNE